MSFCAFMGSNLAVCLRVYVRAFLSLCPQRPFSFTFAPEFPRKRQPVHTFTWSSTKQLGKALVLTAPPLVLSLSYSFPTHISHFFLHPARRWRPLRAVSLPRPHTAARSARPSRALKSLGSCEWARGPAPSPGLFHHCLPKFHLPLWRSERGAGRTLQPRHSRRFCASCAPGERAVPGGAGGRVRAARRHRELSKRRTGGGERGDDQASAAGRSRAPPSLPA